MKTPNAYKMIEKAGSLVEEDPGYHGGLIARFGYYNIELTDQDGEIIAIKVVPAHEQVDQLSGYYPGTYFPSLTRAIEYVIPRRIDGNPDRSEPWKSAKARTVDPVEGKDAIGARSRNPSQSGADRSQRNSAS